MNSKSPKGLIKSVMILLALTVVAACSKSKKDPAPTTPKPQGYIIVNCTNCQVEYGMPDQYKTFTLSGTSSKEYFTYSGQYTLVAYITSLGVKQDLTLSVYSSKDSVLYHGTVTQDITGHWETDTIVPADK